jgi:hypothetical protein
MEQARAPLGEGLETNALGRAPGLLERSHDEAAVDLADDARALAGDGKHGALAQTDDLGTGLGVEAQVAEQVDDRFLRVLHGQPVRNGGPPPSLSESRHVGRDVTALALHVVRQDPGEDGVLARSGGS